MYRKVKKFTSMDVMQLLNHGIYHVHQWDNQLKTQWRLKNAMWSDLLDSDMLVPQRVISIA